MMEKDAPMCNLGQYSFDANFIAIALVRRSYYRKLRVQSEEFSEEKDSFYMILKRKYMYSFRWDSNPRSMDYEANSLPLSYLTC